MFIQRFLARQDFFSDVENDWYRTPDRCKFRLSCIWDESKMIGKRDWHIKQYIIWLRLLAKRLWRQPAYIGLLVLIPILGYAVSAMEQGERGGAEVSVCVEKGTWSSQIKDGLQTQNADSVLEFVLCDDAETVEYSVVSGTADCGFVIPADIEERVMEEDWRKCITVYETAESSITGMAKERISGVIFQLYSEQCYGDYMEQISKDIAEFAVDAYEVHLTDDSTFGFRYMNDNQYSQYNSDADGTYDTAVFPIKGVLAVVIFISGMCGMLEYDKDRQDKRFLRIAPNWLTYAVDVWMTTLFVSVAVVVCLWISDGVRAWDEGFSIAELLSVWSVNVWLSQIGQLIVYQCIIVLYCSILSMILRRPETIAAAIPILSLGSLVCAPVFINLGAYLPVFAVLEKLFPVTYYLKM